MDAASHVAIETTGLYLHFPFCEVRCTYCDFATVAGRDGLIDPYLDVLIREIREGQRELPETADSIYIGGGTPSRMTPEQLARVLDAVRERFAVTPDAEITLEGNPESLGDERLRGYRQTGVTRLSVGVQSLDNGVLDSTGRAHDARTALDAVERARRAGFPEVNVDLIAGLPGEDLRGWEGTLERVLGMGPDHLSVYLLEHDKETPLARSVERGRTRLPGEDAVADAYEATVDQLDERGYEHYEISNFARPGLQSRHNLKYWTDVPYGGFGLGANAYAAGVRRANRRDLDGYLDDVRAGRDPVCWQDPWDRHRRVGEALFLGLRLVFGVDVNALSDRYDLDIRMLYEETWERGEEAGVLEWNGSHVRLTPSGRLRSNELFAEFV